MFRNKRLTIIISCLLIFGAIAAVALFGVAGFGRSEMHQERIRIDAKFFYLAGKTWRHGANPYDPQTACKMEEEICSIYPYAYAYPPSSAIFVMFLALFNLKTALLVIILINIVCLALFVKINLQILAQAIGNQAFVSDIRKSLLVAMLIGNIAVANTFWMGQTGIIISAMLIMSYYFYWQTKDIMSGVSLALALIKPQLAFPLLLWFVLEKKWKILTSAALTTFALFLIPVGMRGIGPTLTEWLNGLAHYLTDPANQAGHFTLSGFRRLLGLVGMETYPSLVALLTSIILIAAIHRYFQGINILNLFGILSVIGLLLGQAHHYDLVLAMAVLPFFFSKIPASGYRYLFLLILFFVIFNLPRVAFLLKFDHWLLSSHREIILLGALLLMLRKHNKTRELSASQ